MRILSVDPGTTNFAYSILDIKPNLNYKIRKIKMVEKTLTEPNVDIKDQYLLFEKEFLLKVKNVDSFICERFQSRGMKGNVIESVNMMIGMMVQHMASIQVKNIKLVTASTWKNRVNKITDLKEIYKLARVPNHITDAVCLGLYYGTLLHKGQAFESFQDHNFQILAEKINNESEPFG